MDDNIPGNPAQPAASRGWVERKLPALLRGEISVILAKVESLMTKPDAALLDTRRVLACTAPSHESKTGQPCRRPAYRAPGVLPLDNLLNIEMAGSLLIGWWRCPRRQRPYCREWPAWFRARPNGPHDQCQFTAADAGAPRKCADRCELQSNISSDRSGARPATRNDRADWTNPQQL